MKLPRTNCRSLIVAVALAAMVAWIYAMCVRSMEYLAMAEKQKDRLICAKLNLNNIYLAPNGSYTRSLNPDDQMRLVWHKREVAREDALYRAYIHAAWLPWTSVDAVVSAKAGR